MRLIFPGALLLLALSNCTRTDTVSPDTQIVVIGDSVLAWHSGRGASVADVIQSETGLATANLSVPGARFTHSSPGAAEEGYDVRAQYVSGPWDWVIVNGGANDLLSECGCARCVDNLDSLISASGQGGDIPALVKPMAKAGRRVMLLGYYDANELPNVFSDCGDEIDVLNARLARLAATSPRVFYTSAEDVMDPSDQRHWFVDRVHPSRKGSRLIGTHVARAILASQ
ncbi:SGNH/GDSL hydrolase family protein [Arenibacterium sp. CAU 1754]